MQNPFYTQSTLWEYRGLVWREKAHCNAFLFPNGLKNFLASACFLGTLSFFYQTGLPWLDSLLDKNQVQIEVDHDTQTVTAMSLPRDIPSAADKKGGLEAERPGWIQMNWYSIVGFSR